jgi:hypothetical protein
LSSRVEELESKLNSWYTKTISILDTKDNYERRKYRRS